MKKSALLSAAAALALSATGAFAQSQGDWTVGVGIGHVMPKDDNGLVAGLPLDVDANTQLTLTLEYFIRDNLGIELLAATPFTHQLNLSGVDIGDVKHLPPTISLNYHFPTKGAFKPFIGAGVNYTAVLDVDTPTLPLLDIEDSWGLAAHFGFDYAIGPNGAIRADVRWIDIDLDVTNGGVDIGTAEVDPWVFSIGYVHRF